MFCVQCGKEIPEGASDVRGHPEPGVEFPTDAGGGGREQEGQRCQ